MTEIKRSTNIIKILNEIEEKEITAKKNKPKSKSHQFQFFPVMDIKNKFQVCNKFDKKNSKKFLKEKDKCLKVVEIDDRLPEKMEENKIHEIAKADPLNITFGN